MYSITFHCKVITPMFISGANQQQAELRAPSIKGALRFWWRAMRADLAQQSLDELRKREGEIFGDTLRRAGVILRVDYESKNLENNITKKLKISTSFNKQERTLSGEDRGIGYLYYSTMLKDGRPYINPEFKFAVTLSSLNKVYLNEACKAFFLLTNLGGLGTRIRRCAGSFCITQVTDPEQILHDLKISFLDTDLDFTTYMNTQLQQLNIGVDKNLAYSNLGGTQLLFARNGKTNWKSAVREIGERFMDYRRTLTGLWQSPGFGLPIAHRSQGYTEIRPEKHERRASPLFMQITKYNNRFHWIVTCLKGDFLTPEEKVIRKKDNRDKHSIDPQFVERFITSLKKDNLSQSYTFK